MITILGVLFFAFGCNGQQNGAEEDIIFREPDNGTVVDRSSIIEGAPLDMVLIYEGEPTGPSSGTGAFCTLRFGPGGRQGGGCSMVSSFEIHDGKIGVCLGISEKPARKSEWKDLFARLLHVWECHLCP